MQQDHIAQPLLFFPIMQVLYQIRLCKIIGENEISEFFFTDRLFDTFRAEDAVRRYDRYFRANHVQGIKDENCFRGHGTHHSYACLVFSGHPESRKNGSVAVPISEHHTVTVFVCTIFDGDMIQLTQITVCITDEFPCFLVLNAAQTR